MRRSFALAAVTAGMVVLTAAPALACGGLVAPNGTINLLRTTTLAAYVDGVEHYVTSFEFAGGGGKFGSIVPLPGIPRNVTRGGDWTLQRLVQEIQPVVTDALVFASADLEAKRATVIQEYEIDALDLTVLKGGGDAVGRWAKDNGFFLPPDAPEMLDFYAARSPIFMAAKFDAGRAKELGQNVGDGTPIHVTIDTDNPWVPLRILGLGRQPGEIIEADVFLLTERAPAMLPKPLLPGFEKKGITLERSELASKSLLVDLRSDKGMKWLPTNDMWLSYLKLNVPAVELNHDLALDVSGANQPSLLDAGLRLPGDTDVLVPSSSTPWIAWLAAGVVCFGILAVTGKVLG